MSTIKKLQVYIKEAIDRRKLTVQEVSDLMGVSSQNVYYLLREGGTQTKISSLISLGEAIGVTDLREFFTPPEEWDHPARISCPECGKTITLRMMGVGD